MNTFCKKKPAETRAAGGTQRAVRHYLRDLHRAGPRRDLPARRDGQENERGGGGGGGGPGNAERCAIGDGEEVGRTRSSLVLVIDFKI